MSELALFKSLAFCWDVFESDGLNDELIQYFTKHLSGELLVIGSGQGIVSRALIDQGYAVDSIELLEEMAVQAQKRRNIKTKIKNFLTDPPERCYDSLIVNTGVILPSMSAQKITELFSNIMHSLVPNGAAVVAYFERSEFDDFVEEQELDRSDRLYEELWRGINQGRSIAEILKGSTTSSSLNFQCKKYSHDLAELEYQIRESGIRFQQEYPEKDVARFIVDNLKYTPFGLNRTQQITLHKIADQAGLTLIDIRLFGKTNIAVFKKPAQSADTKRA